MLKPACAVAPPVSLDGISAVNVDKRCEIVSGKSTVVVFWLNRVTKPKALAEERAIESSGPPWLATPVTIADTVPGGDVDVEAEAAAFPSSNCDVLEATLEEKVIPVPGGSGPVAETDTWARAS